MRRGNFLTVVLVAFVTYFALTAFLGRRTWWRYNHWHYNHYNNPCERGDSSAHYYRNDQPKPAPGQAPLKDSTPLP